jgi:hypothetical protein
MSGVKPDLGKATLMALSFHGWLMARKVREYVMVSLWDIDLGMGAVVSRLEMYVQQGLVEKRLNENGAT